MEFFQVFFLSKLREHLDVFAISVFLLGFSLAISLASKRRPSIFAELLIFVLVGCHLAQILVATYLPKDYLSWLLTFAFVPAREIGTSAQPWSPGSWLRYLWTPFTYALLHADALHLFFNGVGLFIFGRTVAWRLGVRGFVALFFLSAAAGALAHNVIYWADPVPLTGASAGVFGLMGATFRFVPAAEDRLKALFWPEIGLRQLPIVGLFEMLTDRRSLTYILSCFIIFPLGLTALLVGASGGVSVMAHLGGFAVGLLGARYCDWHDPDFQSVQRVETAGGEKSESVGMKLLRMLAIVMVVVGIIMGILEYYLPFVVG